MLRPTFWHIVVLSFTFLIIMTACEIVPGSPDQATSIAQETLTLPEFLTGTLPSENAQLAASINAPSATSVPVIAAAPSENGTCQIPVNNVRVLPEGLVNASTDYLIDGKTGNVPLPATLDTTQVSVELVFEQRQNVSSIAFFSAKFASFANLISHATLTFEDSSSQKINLSGLEGWESVDFEQTGTKLVRISDIEIFRQQNSDFWQPTEIAVFGACPSDEFPVMSAETPQQPIALSTSTPQPIPTDAPSATPTPTSTLLPTPSNLTPQPTTEIPELFPLSEDNIFRLVNTHITPLDNQEEINSFAISQDMDRIAWSTKSGIHIFDYSEDNILNKVGFIGIEGQFSNLVFSPDKNAIAFSSNNEQTQKHTNVEIWRVSDPTPLFSTPLQAHATRILAIDFSPNGAFLASASEDGHIHLWNVADGTYRTSLKEHSLQVVDLEFSPDSTLLASSSQDRTVILWQVDTNTRLHTLAGHSDWVYSIKFSRDGVLLASGDGAGVLNLWRVEDGSLVPIPSPKSDRRRGVNPA